MFAALMRLFRTPREVLPDPRSAERVEVECAVFRVCQEALTNVSKHAGASEVNVSLMQEGDEIVIEIADDGCGLAAAALRKPRSFGLRGIRERLSSLGGRLDLSLGSSPNTQWASRTKDLPVDH